MSLLQNDNHLEQAQEIFEERKRWHNLEAELGLDVTRCKSCGEVLEEQTVTDARLDSIEHYEVCINPACPEFEKDVL